MRKLYLHILSVILIISFNSYSQTATNPSVNSDAMVNNNPISNAFYARITGQHSFTTSCCGQQGGSSKKVVVTYESLNLTLTSQLISELKNSTSTYSDGGTAPNLLSFNGGLNVGDVVNVYMVYLNDNVNRRSSYGEVEFEGEILAVGMDWQHTLWFSGINNPNLGTSDYPRWSYANSSGKSGKFEDRKFEPNTYNSGNFQNAWDNQNTSKDWFQLVAANGSICSPTNGSYNGNAVKKFRLGCSNGQKGDFFRIITTVACQEPTGAGSIGNPQSGCGSFNPSTITNTSSGSGGSGGTATYFWQKSTTSSSSGFSTISGATSTTYNPSTISQTTWYRRGYYRCNSSAAVYTSAVQMTVNSSPTANASASPSSICSGQSTTLIATSVSGASYAWRVVGSSTVISTSRTPTVSPSSTTTYQLTVTKNGCSATDNVTVTVGTEITGAGSINGAESQCTSYNPGNIVNSLSAQGGSGGTLTYFWQKSTTSSSSGFTTISNATSSSYNPPTITQTTWYRRGAYRCNSSSALYTSAVQKTIIGTPTANASASFSSICNGSSVALSTTNVAGQTYQWSAGGTILSNSSSFFHSPTTTTSYQLTVTQYGCSATDNVTVTVNDAPNVGVSGGSSQAACQGGSLTLSGTGASSYSWNNGVTNGQSFSAPGSTTTYTVTGTDANGCSNTAQVTVNITSLLNWANLQFPASETYSCNGGQIAIYGQVYEPGITDGPGQGSGITVEYGYSTTNSNPSTWTNWS